jgi:hypothetical protein
VVAWKHLPFIINSLDNESECWADSIDIFTHDPLDYGGLSSIVKTSIPEPDQQIPAACQGSAYSIKILISLSFNLAFRKIESILEFSRKVVVGCVLDV